MADINIDSTRAQMATDATASAKAANNDLTKVLTDIQTDNILGNDEVADWNGTTVTTVSSGADVLKEYGYTGTADITTATGAMVVDDLMQKISTKVQVASQILAAANNMAKTASRVLGQG